MKNLKYLFVGIFFGFVLTKAEVISWFRIQEMFRFESFHMYGIIGMAVLVGMVSLQIIKKLNARSAEGQKISIKPKEMHKGLLIGGIIFGLGWALTGACPGPIFALIGNGYSVFIVVFISALAGTWTYGKLKEKLPH
ncbi:MAG: DUF6691 family protein [Cyclobacteriaceae bacterium]